MSKHNYPPTDPHELMRQSRKLESYSPQDILTWAYEQYSKKLVFATGFGAEGMVLIHMLSKITPGIVVFNLETGYQFEKTLALKTIIKNRYNIDVQLKKPEHSVTTYEKIHGGPVYLNNPSKCCADRKIAVLKKALNGVSAWVTAIRRDQSSARANAPILSWDQQFNLVKVNPLVNWNKHDVWTFIKAHNIPYNTLYDEGYTSIGCWPCTQKPTSHDERSGRWVGFDKSVC